MWPFFIRNEMIQRFLVFNSLINGYVINFIKSSFLTEDFPFHCAGIILTRRLPCGPWGDRTTSSHPIRGSSSACQRLGTEQEPRQCSQSTATGTAPTSKSRWARTTPRRGCEQRWSSRLEPSLARRTGASNRKASLHQPVDVICLLSQNHDSSCQRWLLDVGQCSHR